MYRITIEGQRYHFPQTWEEIKLKQFIELSDLDIPYKLRELWDASAELSATEEKGGDANRKVLERYNRATEACKLEDWVKTFPKYVGEAMAVLSNIPAEIIERLHADLRMSFFDKHMRWIVQSLYFTQPIQSDGRVYTACIQDDFIESVEVDKKRYYMPRTLKMYGEEVPGGEEEAITFTEASDIEIAIGNLKDKGARHIPMLCALYLRPRGEEYDQKKVLERAKLFEEKLNMDTVWTLFFCIEQLAKNYTSSILAHLKAGRMQRPDKPV